MKERERKLSQNKVKLAMIVSLLHCIEHGDEFGIPSDDFAVAKGRFIKMLDKFPEIVTEAE